MLSTYCGIELPDATVKCSKLSEAAIHTVCDFIETHLCSQITLEKLAALVHLSPFHFARCFKATIGLAPHQYVLARRVERAKRLLVTSTLPVAEIAWAIGYENLSHFRRIFALHTGVTPGVIRQAADIQEADSRYLTSVRDVYHAMAKSRANWHVVDGVRKGELRSVEDVAREIADVAGRHWRA